MNRQEKAAIIADIKKMLSESHATFLVNYKGMTVSAMKNLRQDLRQDGGHFKVTKATLMKIAAKDLEGIEPFTSDFHDQVGLVFSQKDPSLVAKHLVNFSKKHAFLKVVSGFLESRKLRKEEIEFLASLPPKEVLLAQLLGTMQAPISSLARLLNLLIVRLLYTLNRIAEKNSQ